MNTKHPYAELLHAIADGKEIQSLNEKTSSWETISTKPVLIGAAYGDLPSRSLRVKPPTVLINGIEVPEPCREPLKKNERYWMPDLARLTGLACEDSWSGIPCDFDYLNRGLVHLTKEAAETHAKALLSFTSTIKD